MTRVSLSAAGAQRARSIFVRFAAAMLLTASIPASLLAGGVATRPAGTLAAPTATITLSDSLLNATDTAVVTITFSEAVYGFTLADLNAPNGVLSALTSSDGGVTWTTTFTPSLDVQDTTNVITLDNSGVSDIGGISGTGTTQSPNYVIDTVRPTATISLSDTLLQSGETAVVTIAFSEPVTGLTSSALTAANGSLSGLSSSDGQTWVSTFTPAVDVVDASNVITLNLTGVTNAAGNSGSGTVDSPNYAVDTAVRPTSTIALSDTLLLAGETAVVTVTFSEAVSGFTYSDLTVANGSLSMLSSSDGGVTWTTTLTPTAFVIDPTNVITLDNSGVFDADGNTGTGLTSSPNYEVNTSGGPTSTITLSDTALAVGETAVVTITFSEPVTGFTIAQLIAPHAILSGLSSSDGGVTWTVTLVPVGGIEDATNVVTLDNSGVADADGNPGIGTSQSPNYAIDTLRPTATITLSDTLLQSGETAVVTIAFSEPVTGLTTSDLTVPNGSLTGLNSSDGGVTWQATLAPAVDVSDTSNVITLDLTGVADTAGNSGSGTADSPNYAVDTPVRPTATIVLSDTAVAAGETTVVTVSFSEAVTGFTNADLTIENGSLSGLSSSDGGVTWTVTLTPAAGTEDPTNVVTLDNSGVTDADGNSGTGTSQSANFAIDTLRPTATIALSDALLQSGETATVTIVFSEAVTGLTSSDLMSPNGSLSGVASSDGGVTWQATLTPAADVNDASNVMTLDLTGIIDAAGNSGSGTADSPNYAVDTVVAPTATIALSDTALAAGETSDVTVTFSEAVTGFTTSDVTVENGSLSGLSSSDGGITWTATFTPDTGIEDATNVITLDNSGVADTSGTSGTGTTQSPNYTIDTLRPTATITLSDIDLTDRETAVVTIVFSEPVSGVTSSDFSVDNGTLTSLSSADGGLTWTATFSPLTGVNDASNVIVLDNSKVTDAAGNAGVGSTSSSNYRVVPAVAPAAVPTLTTWLQLLLALSLCVVALRVVG